MAECVGKTPYGKAPLVERKGRTREGDVLKAFCSCKALSILSRRWLVSNSHHPQQASVPDVIFWQQGVMLPLDGTLLLAFKIIWLSGKVHNKTSLKTFTSVDLELLSHNAQANWADSSLPGDYHGKFLEQGSWHSASFPGRTLQEQST